MKPCALLLSIVLATACGSEASRNDPMPSQMPAKSDDALGKPTAPAWTKPNYVPDEQEIAEVERDNPGWTYEPASNTYIKVSGCQAKNDERDNGADDRGGAETC